MIKEEIKFSIITITYNCESSIKKTIQSVINQTYKNFEYIIIDGLSSDRTLDIVNAYSDKIDVIVSEKDRGISDAFNKGIKVATGELLFFLNAGDTFISSDILEKVIEQWKQNKTDMLFYKVKVGKRTYIPALHYKECAEKIWNEAQFPHQGAFVRKNVFTDVGNFNIFIKVRMDYDFFLRCRTNNCSYEYVPEIIVDYEVGGTSMQHSNAKTFYREGIAIKLMYGIRINMKDYLYLFMPDWMRRIGRKLLIRR